MLLCVSLVADAGGGRTGLESAVGTTQLVKVSEGRVGDGRPSCYLLKEGQSVDVGLRGRYAA